MNYQDFVTTHRKTGADITVAALPTDEKQATAFGLMKIDGTGRIQVSNNSVIAACIQSLHEQYIISLWRCCYLCRQKALQISPGPPTKW